MFLWRDSNDKPSASRSHGRYCNNISIKIKDTEKHIVDDEVVRSNIKRFEIKEICNILSTSTSPIMRSERLIGSCILYTTSKLHLIDISWQLYIVVITNIVIRFIIGAF